MNSFPEIYPVTCHTRHVGQGSTFVAINGMHHDGHDYIEEALNRGATRIVALPTYRESGAHVVARCAREGIPVVYADDTRLALAELSAQALGYPAKKLKIIGITGTKGKSTTTYLVEHLLATAGYKTAVLSTIKNKILDTILPTELTTQQPDYLHVFFNECVQAGVEWVVMEVAAQALTCKRVEGIEFECFVFTNFSKEHGEFYATQDLYFAAKQSLFAQIKPHGVAILNKDDARVAQCFVPHGTKRYFSLADATITTSTLGGVSLQVDECVLEAPMLVGTFNAYNMLAAYSVARFCGVDVYALKQGMRTFTGVPGRLAKYELPNGAVAFIDYAHNPSSFEALFSTLRPYTHQLIVVFGCGGDRDKTKRPLMGALAVQYADLVILTTDNPRSEEPVDIIEDIRAGILAEDMRKCVIELDREQAITHAYERSSKNSIILLLGKGPDEYQLIKGVKYPFSEATILQNFV